MRTTTCSCGSVCVYEYKSLTEVAAAGRNVFFFLSFIIIPLKDTRFFCFSSFCFNRAPPLRCDAYNTEIFITMKSYTQFKYLHNDNAYILCTGCLASCVVKVNNIFQIRNFLFLIATSVYIIIIFRTLF